VVSYSHIDGTVCVRPGPGDLTVGSIVHSEFTISYGLCEHTIVSVEEFKKAITVADILAAVETRLK
jgi:hypothetical protein